MGQVSLSKVITPLGRIPFDRTVLLIHKHFLRTHSVGRPMLGGAAAMTVSTCSTCCYTAHCLMTVHKAKQQFYRGWV